MSLLEMKETVADLNKPNPSGEFRPCIRWRRFLRSKVPLVPNVVDHQAPRRAGWDWQSQDLTDEFGRRNL